MIQAWILLGRVQYMKGNYNNALNLYIQAQTLSKQAELLPEQCESTIHVGEIIYKSGDYERSLTYFKTADSIATKNNFQKLHAFALYNMGKYNETTGKFSEAYSFYNQAMDICRENKYNKLLAIVLPSLGKYYISQGNLDIALQCYLEALNLSGKLNDQILNAEIANHLGGVYLEMNQYKKALEYHKKSLALRDEMNNPEGLAKSYNNMGKAYLGLGQFDSAIIYLNESLSLCENINYKKGIVKAQVDLGKVYTAQNKIDKAHDILKEALDISGKANYGLGIAQSSLAMGTIYENLHLMDTAIHYYQLCLNTLAKTNYDEMFRDAYQGLFECYSFKGEYKNALNYHILLLETVKGLLNVENNRQLASLNIAFETERKEKDNQVLRNENELKELQIKRNNLFMWFTVTLLGFTIILCFAIYNRFHAKKKANLLLEELNHKVTHQNSELEKLNTELEKVNEEKDKLFSIIAHELRNPLYWFQNLAEVLSKKYRDMTPEKIQKTVVALDEAAKNSFQLMDNLLHWSRSKLNRINPKRSKYSLYSLIYDAVQMYETIIRYKEIEFHNNIPKNIDVFADADLFSCVIRNLVSNAIKFTENKGTISIDCYRSDNHVTVIVGDSGSGIADAELNTIFSEDNVLSTPGLMQEKGSGLGLKLCREFVKLNGGEIWVESKLSTGTQFFFTVPGLQP